MSRNEARNQKSKADARQAGMIMDGSKTVAERIDLLLARIRDEQHPGLDKDVQREMASLVEFLPEVERSATARILIGTIETAVAALLMEPPNLLLAQKLRCQAENTVRIYRGPFEHVWRSSAPTSNVVTGLALGLALGGVAFFVLVPGLAPKATLIGIDVQTLLVLGFAGVVGSVVSIMVRIEQFAGRTDVPRSVLLLNGLFKPIIGLAFALFVYGLLNAGLVVVNIPETSSARSFFFLVLAFLAGFNERLAPDLAQRAESALTATK
jgi:hypothetical protein